MNLQEYHQQSRQLAVSLFFIAPILAVYEVGIFMQGSEIRNGADVLIKSLFSLLGQRGLIMLNLILLATFLIAALTILHRNRPVLVLIFPMGIESLLYALILAPLVLFMHAKLGMTLGASPPGLQDSYLLKLILSMGAGVYEEIVFRLGMISFFFVLLHRWIGLKDALSGVLAVLVASFLFAGFHHVGPLGEPFDRSAFFFRFVSGIILSAIFMIRGLGVAVATHALYNILIFTRQVLSSMDSP